MRGATRAPPYSLMASARVLRVSFLILALHEVAFRWPQLWLTAVLAPSANQVLYLTLPCCLVAGLLGWRHPRYLLEREGLLGALLGLGALALAWSYARSAHFFALIWLLPVLLAALTLANLGSHLRLLGGTSSEHRRALLPSGVLLCSAVLVVGALCVSLLGQPRSGLWLGGTLAAGVWLPELGSLQGEPTSRRPGLALRVSSLISLVGIAALAYSASDLMPFAEVRHSAAPLVAHAQGPREKVTVTASQGYLAIFVDDELRTTTLDARRYVQCLVQPALAAASHPTRALLLGRGDGLVEAELLRDPRIQSIESVARDAVLRQLARHLPAYRQLHRDTLDDRRVHFTEQDPAEWLLEERAGGFDVMVIDLPDPGQPRTAKYYSRYVLSRVTRLLRPAGVLAIQGTSPRRSPQTFATLGKTLTAAGFEALPLRVPLLALGEWGLWLATVQPAAPPSPLPHLPAGFPRSNWAELSYLPRDTLPEVGFSPRVSTLHDAVILHRFEHEEHRQ